MKCDIDNKEKIEIVKLLLLQYLEDIKYCKKQQWQVGYYLFVIQAVIINWIQDFGDFTWVIYYIISTIVTVFSGSIIIHYAKQIKSYREKKNYLRELILTDDMLSVFVKNPDDTKKIKKIVIGLLFVFQIVIYGMISIALS